MDGQRRFAVIGTDARLAAAGRALARAGFAVGGPEQTALADYILLPLRWTRAAPRWRSCCGPQNRGHWALGGKLSAQARQDRGGGGRGAGGLLCPGGADPLQRHPDSRGLHRHPDGRADADALEQRHALLAGFGPVGQALGVRLRHWAHR